jgi:glycosyltransferase involved in cell wall biosynthesis
MDAPIRILHVFSQMSRGGAETMMMNIYRKIDHRVIQFDFMVHTEEAGDYDDEIKSYGGRIFFVPRYTGKNHFQYKKKWLSFLESHQEYRFIHGHVRSTAVIYLKLAKKLGFKTIAHSHNTSSGSGLPAVVKSIYQYPLRNLADYLFACSEVAGQWLFGKRACQQGNFFILKNAIETQKFIFSEELRERKRKELGVSGKYVIGHIGNFKKQKNHEFVIDVFEQTIMSNKDAILLLIGDGELKSAIEKKVFDLGLQEYVIFAGVRSDIPECLHAMDVFLFPSFFEGLPVTLIEAQAAGLPCVVSATVTDEVKITPYILFVSLDETAKAWAELVDAVGADFTRENTAEMIIASGYDIHATSNWLQKFYKNQ